MCIITIIIKTLYAMRIDATIDVNSHSLFFTHSLNVLYNRISTISISPITVPINNIVNIAFTRFFRRKPICFSNGMNPSI